MADQHNANIPAVGNTIVADVADIKENLEYHKDCFEVICTGWSDTVTTNLAVGGLRRSIVEIDDWDMDATATLAVAHSLTLANIRAVNVTIRNDADTAYYTLPAFPSAFTDADCVLSSIDETNVNLSRSATGLFNSTDFNATSFNRGWIIIDYIP